MLATPIEFTHLGSVLKKKRYRQLKQNLANTDSNGALLQRSRSHSKGMHANNRTVEFDRCVTEGLYFPKFAV